MTIQSQRHTNLFVIMEAGELKNLDMITMVDMLANKTSDYMNMLRTGGPEEEYRKCKELIKLLTEEIKSRKNGALEK